MNAPKACSVALRNADCLAASIVNPLPLAVIVTSLFSVCEIPIEEINRIKNIIPQTFHATVFILQKI